VQEEEIIRCGKAVADTIRAKREALGLSKNALSQKAGISIQSLSFIENSVNSPSLSTFLRICCALEVRPDCLLREALGNG
jgi:transcriptional regulator with XRE-family HTH domain